MDSALFWTTTQRKINDLIPFDGNPRQLNEKQVADLRKSVERFNLVEIPAINTTNKILAGHQRLKIMQLLGRGEEIIDVRIPSRELTQDEEREYLVRSNLNTGDWDFDELANWNHEDLIAFGFDAIDLAYHFQADATDLGSDHSESNVHKLTMANCPNCGHEFEVKRKKAKNKNDGTSTDSGNPGSAETTQTA